MQILSPTKKTRNCKSQNLFFWGDQITTRTNTLSYLHTTLTYPCCCFSFSLSHTSSFKHKCCLAISFFHTHTHTHTQFLSPSLTHKYSPFAIQKHFWHRPHVCVSLSFSSSYSVTLNFPSIRHFIAFLEFVNKKSLLTHLGKLNFSKAVKLNW